MDLNKTVTTVTSTLRELVSEGWEDTRSVVTNPDLLQSVSTHLEQLRLNDRHDAIHTILRQAAELLEGFEQEQLTSDLYQKACFSASLARQSERKDASVRTD